MEKTIMALLVEPEGLPREAAVLVTEDGLAAVLGAGPLEVRGVRRNARSGAVLTSVAMLCRREILIAARDIHPDAGGYPGPDMSCCPACGGDLIRETYLIKGGPEAGKTEIGVYCPFCGYEEYWIL